MHIVGYQGRIIMRLLSAVRSIGVVALALSTPAAFAGGVINGTVQQVFVRASDGLIYVVINGTASDKPACAGQSYWVIMDETSDVGHKQYELLLAAASSGVSVGIHGNGTCTRWPDGEDIDS